MDAEAQDEDGQDEEEKLLRKMHLFQCWSVQESIRRFWPFLSLQEGVLGMEGYVELNLALQKALAEDFQLERAVDSAIGDWSEDIREGQEAMVEEDFTMFLFELCTLWCGPNVSLSVYLLFLSSVFIAVTDARGAYTLGLRKLEDVQRLPQSFFELLSLQGWSSRPAEKSEDSLASWLRCNVAQEVQQATVDQVQKQVFQLTHDARSVFLFGNEANPPGIELLDLVKTSTSKLAKVAQTDVSALPVPHSKPSRPKVEVSPPQAIGTLAVPKQSRVAVPRPALQDMPKQELPKALPPLGRVYDTQLVQYQGRGLGLAGQSAVMAVRKNVRSIITASSLASNTEGLGATEGSYYNRLHDRIRGSQSSVDGVSGFQTSVSGEVSQETPDLGVQDSVSPKPGRGSPPGSAGASAVRFYTPPPEAEEQATTTTMPALEAPPHTPLHEEQEALATFFDGTFLPSYSMPTRPPEVYRKQVEPLMKGKPSSMIFEAQKWQAAHQLLNPPFDRVLRKLPPNVRPGRDVAPPGPMGHPCEPVWFEMQHRLEVILRKQGRRAERRRKRRLRQKLYHGRAPRAGLGRNLREYLDLSFAQREDVPGEPNGEFLGKVHEQYMQRRGRDDQRGFRVHGNSESVLRKVVRPIYIPPPGVAVVAGATA